MTEANQQSAHIDRPSCIVLPGILCKIDMIYHLVICKYYIDIVKRNFCISIISKHRRCRSISVKNRVIITKAMYRRNLEFVYHLVRCCA
jgi:hypothetical protein